MNISAARFYPANRDAAGRAEFWAHLALRYCRKLGPVRIKALLEHFGSALNAVENAAAWEELGIPLAAVSCMRSGAWREKARVEWDSVRDHPCPVLLWRDPEYPELLRAIEDPPPFLYFLGDLSLLGNVCVAVVGARDCSVEGLRGTVHICRGLARAGVTIVSGMARGIDRAAHLTGLEGPGSSIAVLGTGLDAAYPRENLDLRALLLEKGLLITEYGPGISGRGRHFTIRNRIISGISRGVLVAEAALRSGSLNTARHALEQNRELMSIPGTTGAAHAEGCKELVRRGAKPVFSSDDVLRELLPFLVAAVRGEVEARDLGRFSGKKQTPAIGEGELPDTLAPGLLPWGVAAADGLGETIEPDPPVPAEHGSRRQKNASNGRGASRPARGSIGHPAPAAREEIPDFPLCEDGGPDNVAENIRRLLHFNTLHIDDICRALGQNADVISRTLLLLEVGGKVRRLPGMLYTAPE